MRRYIIGIYYIVPIVIHLIFLPFCFLDMNGMVELIELVIGTIVVPIYLIIISTKFLNDFSANNYFIMLTIMLVITVAVSIIGYVNWGVTTGKLLNPDSETVYITKLEIIISAIIIFVGWSMAWFIKHKIIQK